jgi:hypothetical protein
VTDGVWRQTGPTVTLPPEALGLAPWPRQPGPPMVVESVRDGVVTMVADDGRTAWFQQKRMTIDELVRFTREADPAYRILREQHRRSWLAAMRTIRGALARWLP